MLQGAGPEVQGCRNTFHLEACRWEMLNFPWRTQWHSVHGHETDGGVGGETPDLGG